MPNTSLDSHLEHSALSRTHARNFGLLDVSSRPIFSVNAGVELEDVLLNAVMLLKCSEAICREAAEHLERNDKALAIGMIHCTNSARALIEALFESADSVPFAAE
ncbi:hypothetical protein GCM10009504_30560 [Pseudomonas laurentiana]|uniref:DUF3077 domain-containing protein n=1 Tax=Pseudomonas laurentiana TaxID=2364649 RepID=UPI00167891B9|nr:DUF3077 domain-containing protein [Pseudomonas laurentiana]GGU71157.1 hypothetical protein GCM10009504_30560 [Pseudomonas laurentiana]